MYLFNKKKKKGSEIYNQKYFSFYNNINCHSIIALDCNNRVCGALVYGLSRNSNSLYIQEFGVATQYRNMKVGTMLISIAQNLLKSETITAVVCSCKPEIIDDYFSNDWAVVSEDELFCIYEKLGFKYTEDCYNSRVYEKNI